MGKRTWTPGKTLQRFITATFGIQSKEPRRIVQTTTEALTDQRVQSPAAKTEAKTSIFISFILQEFSCGLLILKLLLILKRAELLSCLGLHLVYEGISIY